MPTSQNGYTAPITPVGRALPGGSVPLRAGATGDLLAWVGRQFHARVEPLIWPGCWGYAYRDVRGATDLSNHASGTALDLNAPKHPLGTSPSANYTSAQIATIHAIVAQTSGCVRWGGDYVGRKDPMHFEIVASEAACAAVLARLAAAPPAGGGTAGGGTVHDQEDEDVSSDVIIGTGTGTGPDQPWQDLVVPVNGHQYLRIASTYQQDVIVQGISMVDDTPGGKGTHGVSVQLGGEVDADRPGPWNLVGADKAFANYSHIVARVKAPAGAKVKAWTNDRP
ncbi:M15 family metallopeptidase [Amycolatopsis sp. NPDC005232]|uniref:M15 family metallopeptidase n=1 Tax=Amycolatopsis sp. NPDC005232 TaxID=3157027 RepID=UPI00339E2311